MKLKLLFFLLLPLLIISCLKNDALEFDPGSNFLQSDFYNNEFEQFAVAIDGISYRTRIVDNKVFSAPTINYSIDSQYLNRLRSEWGKIAILEISIPENNNPFQEDVIDTSFRLNYNLSNYTLNSGKYWENNTIADYDFTLRLVNDIDLIVAEDTQRVSFQVNP